MPAKLLDDIEKATYRLRAADLELLRLLFPGKVNDVLRELVTRYCDQLRIRGFGTVPSSNSVD